MAQRKSDIRTWSREELQKWFVEQGEQSFRGSQVYDWLWKRQAKSFDEMTNLSIAQRSELEEHFELPHLTLAEEQHSDDGTIKSAFKLHDNSVVEGVLIPTDSRFTACISSQIGCSLSCKFCATGKLKRLRNLKGHEIVDQVVGINKQSEEKFGKPLSNIVYMGMGEPLLNYKGLMDSVDRITASDGLGMSPKRITVSTAGIARQIRKLADDNVRFNLALSLHAANDKKRSEIMPINDSNTLEVLMDSLDYFFQKTKGALTFEYIIFKAFNDSLDDAKELVSLCKRFPVKVNIIEYNPIDDAEFERAEVKVVDRFAHYLESEGVNVTIRRSRGKDIDAACGQLANKNQVTTAE